MKIKYVSYIILYNKKEVEDLRQISRKRMCGYFGRK